MASPFPEDHDALSPDEVAQIRQLLAERSAAVVPPAAINPAPPAGAGVQGRPDPPALRQANPDPPVRRLANTQRNSRSRSRGPRRASNERALQVQRALAAYCLRYGRSGVRPSFDSVDPGRHSWRPIGDKSQWARGQIRGQITVREIELWLHTDTSHIKVSGDHFYMRRKRQ